MLVSFMLVQFRFCVLWLMLGNVSGKSLKSILKAIRKQFFITHELYFRKVSRGFFLLIILLGGGYMVTVYGPEDNLKFEAFRIIITSFQVLFMPFLLLRERVLSFFEPQALSCHEYLYTLIILRIILNLYIFGLLDFQLL